MVYIYTRERERAEGRKGKGSGEGRLGGLRCRDIIEVREGLGIAWW